MVMDDTLPAALATNLDAAFERLVRSHQDRLYTIALRLLGDPRDAEGAAQAPVARRPRRRSALPARPPAGPGGWRGPRPPGRTARSPAIRPSASASSGSDHGSPRSSSISAAT